MPGPSTVPVTVRLTSSTVDKIFPASAVRYAADVHGYENASIDLLTPVQSHAPEIAHLTDCIVYDTRSAEVEYQGRLTIPARGGLVQQVSAEGGQAHLDDRTKSMTYVERSLGGWVRSNLCDKAARTGTRGESDELELHVPQGTTATVAFRGDMAYRGLAEAGQDLARVAFNWDSGVTTANWRVQLVTRDGDGGGTVVGDDASSSGGGALSARTDGGTVPIPAGHDVCSVRFERATSTETVPNDDRWITAGDVVVVAKLYDKTGALVSTANFYANRDYVTADEVCADLLGRLLTHIDGATAEITASAYEIDQLAYPGGATPRQVLDDVLGLVGDWRYAVWEWTQNRKWRFQFGPYPTTVDFQIRRADHQFDPPSGADPYNEVDVIWTSPAGRAKRTPRTASVPALTAAGLTRTARSELGSEVGTTANAAAHGDVFLAVSQAPTTGGRLVISTPIVDLQSGRTLYPWQLPRHMPGRLVQVDIPPESYTTPAVRDGKSVLRVLRCEYDTSTAAATCELDASFRFTARQAKLRRKFEARRR